MKKEKALTDEQIIALVIDGKVDRFEELVQRYQNKMFRFVYQKVLNSDDAMELTQEVFLKVFNSLKKFDIKRKFSPWIYKIALNETYNFIKKRSRGQLVHVEDEYVENMVKTENELLRDEYNRNEEDEVIRKTINELPEKYQGVIYYFYLEEMSLKEVSEILGIKVGSVKTRLTRGRRMLKEKLITHGIT